MSELDPSAPAVPPDPSAQPPEAAAPLEASEAPPAEVYVPPPPALPLAPVAAGERIDLIDVIRGMALFGILAANIRAFAGPAATYFMPHLFWPDFPNRLAQAFIDAFVQGKFITIFATLFGVGFGVQVDRALRRGGSFNWTWARRCFVLMLFGLVHGLLIWFGDILLVYALVGFLLLPFKRRENKTLLIWASILYFVPFAFMVLMFIASMAGAPMPPMPVPAADAIAKTRELFANGAWLDINAARMHDAVAHNWGFAPFYFWQIWGLFLFGLLLWQKGFFQPSPESLPRYRRTAFWALFLGSIGNVLQVAMRWMLELPPMPTSPVAFLAATLQTLATPVLSLGYVCFIVLLFHDPVWRARIQRFGNVGRTAFTNYLLQSVIGTLIFYSYGLGFFGRIGPAWLLLATVVIFAIQVVLSRLWLERYRFGPMEWLWRKLTYRGPLPMRRETAIAAAPELIASE